MQKYIFIALVIVASSTKLQCSDLNQEICSQAIRCKWSYGNSSGYKCRDKTEIVKRSICDNMSQDSCQIYKDCGWSGTKCQQLTFESCEQITEKYYCEQQGRSFGQNCDWRYNKCVPVSSCAETYGVYFCRNNKQQERCSTYDFKTKENIHYQSRMAIYNLFDNFVCAPKDCYYEGSLNYCKPFMNGKRCFISTSQECTSCIYFPNHKSCVEQKVCTWDQSSNQCRDIKCSEMSSPSQCSTQPQCNWDAVQLTCLVSDPALTTCYDGAMKFNKIPTGNRFPSDL